MAKFCRKELIYGFIIMLGSIDFGFSIAFPSPLTPFFRDEWKIKKVPLSFFTSILSLTAVIGPYITTFILMYTGRRTAFCILQATSAVFYLIMLASGQNRFWLFIFMRAMMGLVIGGISSTCPTMLIETAPSGLSGFFGNLNQTGVCIGMIIIYLQGNWTVNLSKNVKKWRSLEITTAVINIVSCFLIWICPETGHPTKNDQKDENQEKPSICQKKYFTKLLVGIFLMFIQQFCGINAIVQNLDDNLRDANVPIDSGIGSAISTVFMIIGVFSGGFVIDKLGRMPLFVISCVGCATTLFIYAMNYQFNWNGWIALVCICFYMFFFGFALGPVPWYVIPELFPHELRSLGNSIVSTSNQLLTFVILFLFPIMIGTKDPNTGKYHGGMGYMPTCLFFAACSLLGGLGGYFFITEPDEILLDNKE